MINPSPEQGKEEVLAETRAYSLNHLSPEGWWDSAQRTPGTNCNSTKPLSELNRITLLME